MSNTREDIIREARSWLTTPFKHQGRIKLVGCDCAGLIIGVLTNLNLKILDQNPKDLDKKNYKRIPQNGVLKNYLDEILDEAKIVEAGDIILMKFLNEPQHVGFVSKIENEKIYIIHAYQQNNGVVEHSLSENWKRRIIKYYNIESAITK